MRFSLFSGSYFPIVSVNHGIICLNLADEVEVILLNMFIAVIQESFDVSEDEKRLQQVKAFLQKKEVGGSSNGYVRLSMVERVTDNEHAVHWLCHPYSNFDILRADVGTLWIMDPQ